MSLGLFLDRNDAFSIFPENDIVSVDEETNEDGYIVVEASNMSTFKNPQEIHAGLNKMLLSIQLTHEVPR